MLYRNRAIVLILMLSLASMMSSPQARTIHTDASAPTAIQKELVRVKRIPKPKIFRSNPIRASYFLSLSNTDDDFAIQDEDLATAYRKRDFTKIRSQSTPDDPDGLITEEIRWKLFLARTAAMIAYRNKWA